MQQCQLLAYLAQAESHVCSGERLVARQREFIIRLAQDGHDVTTAMALLQQLEEVQALHVADCVRLRHELGLPR